MIYATEYWFWILLAVGLYPYLGYPLCVVLLSIVNPRPVRSGDITPRVTVVVAAYNEALHIETTILNKLDQDYPEELLDLIVVSDSSTDETDAVLRRLVQQHPRVSYFRQQSRNGKTAALNLMVARAKGEIIVFADANSMYRRDTVRRLVAPFADPRVGYADRADALHGFKWFSDRRWLHRLYALRELAAQLRDADWIHRGG